MQLKYSVADYSPAGCVHFTSGRLSVSTPARERYKKNQTQTLEWKRILLTEQKSPRQQTRQLKISLTGGMIKWQEFVLGTTRAA